LDSIRRKSSGLSGFSLDHQQRFIQQKNKDPLFAKMMKAIEDSHRKRLLENISVGDLRQIARVLIQAGANVNAEHASPYKGYTPLMLAVELDEREIFEQMLIYGGDIKKTYKDPKTGRDISILEIAKSFKSKNVIQVLDDISPYVTVH
jgi:ankyrin repeat protein